MRWLPVIVWMGVIFYLSSHPNPYWILPQSMNQEIDQLLPVISISQYTRHQVNINEAGHSIEYILLSVLMLRAIRGGKTGSRQFWGASGWSVLACFAFALSDEIHQFFVPSRTFQLVDLALGLAAILLGLGLFGLARATGSKAVGRSTSKKSLE